VSCLLIKCCKYFVFCSSTSAVFTAVLIMSSTIPLTLLSLDTDETIRNLSIEFSVARLFMFLLIFNEQRVPKFTFVLVLTYYVKPHLFVILTAIGWFIVNIQSDLIWHRCLERQAFGTPRMYTLSPSKGIKESNYGEFLKDKNVLLCTRLYKYASNLESLLTQQYVCVMCTACGQKWFRFHHLPYIFHIKPFIIFITFSWSHSLSDFHEIFSIKCRNKYSFFFV
jgi:hypothetical protein